MVFLNNIQFNTKIPHENGYFYILYKEKLHVYFYNYFNIIDYKFLYLLYITCVYKYVFHKNCF